MKKLIALSDCNNFFVSCERVFRPDLENKPVMVLSSNDGCVISRSNEVKDLGIGMGVPFYKVQNIVEKNKVNVFSTNFALYGNISNRIMHILNEYTPNLEVYSIDESFLDLSGMDIEKIEKYTREIVKRIKHEVGVPVSIGISQTKTLAKIASKYAKKNLNCLGSKYIDSSASDEYLKLIEVKDIWGVGWALEKSLNKEGIFNALELKGSDIGIIRKKYGVSLQKTVLELNGQSCINISNVFQPKKNIIRSRSFGQKISKIIDLQNALSTFISQGAADLRKHHIQTNTLSVFIRTDKHRESDQQYRNFFTVTLPHASNDTILLTKTAVEALNNIFKPNLLYKKAGIMFSNIVPESDTQFVLGQDLTKTEKNKPLMKVLDHLNMKYGEFALHIASEGEKPKWTSRSRLKSPNYLSSWDELPIVK
jgi:DNA polymerase V